MPDWPYIAMFAPWLPVAVGVWIERRRESRQREAVSSPPPDGLLLKGKGRYKIVTDDDIDELAVNLPDGAKVELDCKGTIGELKVLNGSVGIPAKDMKCVVLDEGMEMLNVPNDVVVLKAKGKLRDEQLDRIQKTWEKRFGS